MFRLVRTVIVVMIAFAAGMLVAKADMRDACLDADGDWQNGMCYGTKGTP